VGEELLWSGTVTRRSPFLQCVYLRADYNFHFHPEKSALSLQKKGIKKKNDDCYTQVRFFCVRGNHMLFDFAGGESVVPLITFFRFRDKPAG
jgi:hypothetical protein